MTGFTSCSYCGNPIRKGDPKSFGICLDCLYIHSRRNPTSLRHRKAMMRGVLKTLEAGNQCLVEMSKIY